MNRAHDFNLGKAAHAALAGDNPPSAWDDRLRAALKDALADTHYREGRFLLVVIMVVAVLSLATDLLVAPQNLGQVAAVRLGLVLPLSGIALLLPRRLVGLQKVMIALALIAFGLSMAFASLFVPSPGDALLALGVVTLLALALPVLPFRGPALVAFILLYVLAVGGFLYMSQHDIVKTSAFAAITIVTAATATIIAHRVHWLERRNLLLTLEAGSRAATLEGSNARLTELSMEDPLTGLANRRRAEQAFAEHYSMPATAGQAGPALFMLDLDHFKAFNDRWGHQAGDADGQDPLLASRSRRPQPVVRQHARQGAADHRHTQPDTRQT